MTEPGSSSAPSIQAPKSSPAGTCDCHIHIYGPSGRYPVAPTSPFPVEERPVAAYRAVMKRLGIERVVVVQPSAYGTDNRCTLDAMAELGDLSRGVAVVDETITDSELRSLTEAGIRGIRFFMLRGGVLPWSALEPMAARVAAFGWHVQLQMDGRDLPDRVDSLLRLPGELVIDHTGKFLEPVGTDHPGYRALLRLLENGKTWVKLSAPYETSKEGAPRFMDVGRLARGLVAAAPERMVWASNWPHPSAQDNPPDDAQLLDVLRYWVEDDSLTARILAENPAKLYGF